MSVSPVQFEHGSSPVFFKAAVAVTSTTAVWRWLFAALLWLQFGLGAGAWAQSIESVLAPGKLTSPHAKYEGECDKCHLKFDRKAQDRLCMDCHKEVRQDVSAKHGLHGLMKQQTCRSCHTDHKGLDAKIAAFEKSSFDHKATNYLLKGAHQKTDCAKCHVASSKEKGYRISNRECIACHKKDDTHKGSLGDKCADCHTEADWKEAKIDHDKTDFPLEGKHVDVKCKDCHKDTKYKDTPNDCYTCHKKEDKHKGHYSEKCEKCHNAKSWKTITFDHNRDTKYDLLGKHKSTKCDACHTTGWVYKDKLTTGCNDCHQKDDKHKETLGTDCAKCHTERDWKEPPKFDHNKTDFPLTGKHAKVECKICHASAIFNQAPKTCIGCHTKDDTHKGTLGEDCAACHDDKDWKKTSFNHDKTKFPLKGKHAKAKCDTCHKPSGNNKTPNYKEAPKDCYSCHKKEDKHEGQSGKLCGACHDEKEWKPAPKFDHGLTRFPLLGKHGPLECKKCHETPRYKDAKVACVACHAKDDKHKKKLSSDCALCHNAQSWKTWTYDHDARTRFPLEGKHKKVACEACHTKPVEGRALVSQQCASCHTKDDIHEGSYGRQCQQCHTADSFKNIKQRPGRAASAVSLSPQHPGSGAVRQPGAMSRLVS